MNTTITVALSDVWAFLSDNVSRFAKKYSDFYAGDPDYESMASLLYNGIDPGKGTLGVRDMTESEQAQAVKEIEVTMGILDSVPNSYDVGFQSDEVDDKDKIKKHIVHVPSNVLARAFRVMHYDKDNKVIAPTKAVTFGFRRFGAIALANAARLVNEDFMYLSMPVSYEEYSSSRERFERTIAENTLRGIGTRMLRPKDHLSAALHMFNLGYRQIDMRKLFKDGVGQKLWSICVLNKRYPQAEIIDNLLNQIDPKAKSWQFGPLDKSQLQKLVAENADEKTVLDYFTGGTSATKAQRVMPKTGIESIRDNNPITIVQDAMAAILTDSSAPLEKYLELSDTKGLKVRLINWHVDRIINLPMDQVRKEATKVFGKEKTDAEKSAEHLVKAQSRD